MSERQEKAKQYFQSGCNCAQAVVAAFCDLTGLDEATSFKLAAGLGGGLGRMREVCGAFNGAAIVLGLLKAEVAPSHNASTEIYTKVQNMAALFKAETGSIICRDMLSTSGIKVETSPAPDNRTPEYYRKRPCVEIVALAVEVLEKELEK